MIDKLANFMKSKESVDFQKNSKEELMAKKAEYEHELWYWNTDLHSMYCNNPRQNLRKIKSYKRKLEAIEEKIGNVDKALEGKYNQSNKDKDKGAEI